MFGFVIANMKKLSQAEQERYRSVYCGLCRALGDAHGLLSRLTLTYDMAFLILLLSSLDKTELAEEKKIFCALHPTKRRLAFVNRHTRYAADLNLLLAYYQRLDDWKDEKKLSAYFQSAILSKTAVGAVRQKYPRQSNAIHLGLQELTQHEQNGESNPDLPACCFGNILGEVFVPDNHPQSEQLFAFGNRLGRIIYLMDAAIDLKKDLKQERYNPLVAVDSSRHEELLQILMADCIQIFEQLPLLRDQQLMENILYSGIWTRYHAYRQGEKKA